jgi:hypothetical protein
MADVFDIWHKDWIYKASASTLLCGTSIPLPQSTSCSSAMNILRPMHNASWWAKETKDFDFSSEDKVDAALYNQILWKGTMGDDRPYPTARSGRDLRQNRKQLLEDFRKAQETRQLSTENHPAGGN